MTQFNVRAENPDNSTDNLAVVKGRGEFEAGSMYTIFLKVVRDDLNNSSLVQGQSEIYIEDGNGNIEDSGILSDIRRKDAFPTLVVDSWEARGQTEEPAFGANADSGSTVSEENYTGVNGHTIVSDQISNVDMWSEAAASKFNTTAAPDDPIDIFFQDSDFNQKIREVEEELLRYIRFDGTQKGVIEYLSKSEFPDNTGTTLDPNNMQDMQVMREEFGGRKTHVKVTGFGPGGNALKSVTKAISSYTGGDPKYFYKRAYQWKTAKTETQITNKLNRIANNIVDDIEDPHIEVTGIARKNDVGDIRLYDQFTVKNSAQGLSSQTLTVVKYEKHYESQVKFDVVLSNYLQEFGSPEDKQKKKNIKNIDAYQRANAGSPTVWNASAVRNPVGPNNNWEMPLTWPDDIVHKGEVPLTLFGRNYRAFSSGAASGGGTTTTTAAQGQITSDTKIIGGSDADGPTPSPIPGEDDVETTIQDPPTDWYDVTSKNLNTNAELVYAAAFLRNESSTESRSVRVRLYDKTKGKELYKTYVVWGVPGSNPVQSITLIGNTTGYDPSGNDVWVQISGDSSVTPPDTWNITTIITEHEAHTHSLTLSPHTHAPEPGMTDFDGSGGRDSLYPQNIGYRVYEVGASPPQFTDVSTGGGTFLYGADDGNQEFAAEVDIADNLSGSGAYIIEVSSQSLGHLMGTVGGRVFLGNI